ncbi:MAG TPA: ADP-glyceromanno-heptose 6-epimerase [Alphaproteobacteria bacterium]|nr:ADP-glyceromanno-heptose 6-epimerase [Alphaproteobacteria bacterium]
MIIVTGGAGFIGSNLVAALEKRGERDVVVVDRFGADDKWRNLAKRSRIDIMPPEGLAELVALRRHDIRAIFHLGAISTTTERDVDLILANNWRLSAALWDLAVRFELRFVYASSAATYGDGGQGFDDDVSMPALSRLLPLNPYAWSKHLFDLRVARCLEAGERTPRQWAGLKFFNVFGPNEGHKGGQMSVVPQFHRQILANGAPKLFRSYRPDYPDGGQTRDFIHVDDAVAVMLWLLDQPDVNGLFNVGTGKARSFLDITNAIFATLGRKPEIEFIDMPEGLRDRYQYFTEARTDRLRAAGFDRPFTALEDGVADYVKRFLAASDPYR